MHDRGKGVKGCKTVHLHHVDPIACPPDDLVESDDPILRTWRKRPARRTRYFSRVGNVTKRSLEPGSGNTPAIHRSHAPVLNRWIFIRHI